MKKSKKISIGVFAAAMVASPMIVVSCGNEKPMESNKKEEKERKELEKKQKQTELVEKAKKEEARKALVAKQDAIQKKNAVIVKEDMGWNKRKVLLISNEIQRVKNLLTIDELIIGFKDHTILIEDFYFKLPTLKGGATFEFAFKKMGAKTIEVSVHTHTPGATVPNGQIYKIELEHLTDDEVAQEKKWLEQEKLEKIAAEKKRKEWKKRGYDAIGDSNEVWYNPIEKILIDEYNKSDWGELLDTERYIFNGINITEKPTKFPIKKLVLNNVTLLTKTSKYGYSFKGIETLEAKKLEHVTNGAFWGSGWSSLKKVIAPKLERLDYDFGRPNQKLPFGYNNGIEYWDLSQVSKLSGWADKWIKNDANTVVVIANYNKMDKNEWERLMRDGKTPKVQFKHRLQDGTLIDLKWGTKKNNWELIPA